MSGLVVSGDPMRDRVRAERVMRMLGEVPAGAALPSLPVFAQQAGMTRGASRAEALHRLYAVLEALAAAGRLRWHSGQCAQRATAWLVVLVDSGRRLHSAGVPQHWFDIRGVR
ncbi:hypothetical protein [Sandarakinorhabdus sp.]|uniref:hypothetical protein n=1 Tax=Sandarakinorhabdus sp. TaxID=1916663 RepID=UPI003567A3EF